MGFTKFYILFLILTINYLPSIKQNKVEELKVKITNIKHDKGKILAAIYSSKEDFLTTPLQYRASEIEAGKTSVEIIFEGLEANEYAISIFHDENGNGILDKNMLGIPKEPFGFSNNARAKFSAPSFEDCMVGLTSSESTSTIAIEVKNW
ncbi:MAG: DUF2141 domain-containing protein [Chitinophagales bacterium]